MNSEFNNVNFTEESFCRKKDHKAWIMESASNNQVYKWGRVTHRFSDIEMPCEQEAGLLWNLCFIKK